MPFNTRRFKGLKFDRKKVWIIAILTFFMLWFLISFGKEIGLSWQLVRGLIGLPNALSNAPPEKWAEANHSLIILLFNFIFCFVPAFLAWVYLISSQALLPISNIYEIVAGKSTWALRSSEVYRTAWHFMLYIFREHGPAVFIQNGKELSTPQEKKRVGPGVIVVDFNSALVLEQQLPPVSLTLPFFRFAIFILEALGLTDPMPALTGKYTIPQRAAGPGIVFTRAYERIRGVIDLRKQSRFLANISAYTRDGIEVTTKGIWTTFTVGQDPRILEVTQIGGRQAENLKAIIVKTLENGKVQIAKLPDDEIDEDDRQSIQKNLGNAKASKSSFSSLPDELPTPLPKYDKDRVFQAISSIALDSASGQPWDTLPAQVATDLFRETILNVNYDRIYNPENPDPDDTPLVKIREKFDLVVRNTGLLSYRMLFHKNGSLLTEGIYDAADLRVSPVYALPVTKKKVLRERGIKVMACGFLELKASQAVYQQRLDTWRASWDSEKEVASAIHELDASHVRSRARAQAQRELTHVLSQLFSEKEYTQEALAIRVLQALEKAATDPATHRLLPGDTINLIRAAHDWLPIKEPTLKIPPMTKTEPSGAKLKELPPGAQEYDGGVKPQEPKFH